jgi:DNA repair protein RadA/Sms
LIENSQNKIDFQKKSISKVKTITQILDKNVDISKEHFKLHPKALNEFWGNGIAPSSLTLLAGEPGLGKSTLALQILRSLKNQNPDISLLYITGEESQIDLARRSKRLGIPQDILILQSNIWNTIKENLLEIKPDVVILDSIQTIFDQSVPSGPGSVSQVTMMTSNLLEICKTCLIASVIIGHVTKEGQIAGPKTLEHMVDSVLMLESSSQLGFRTLSFQKHRFGSTQEMLLLKMENTGLQIITNPGLVLLENLEDGIGVSYAMTIEKNLPIVVEIQTLVNPQKGQNEGGNWMGKRETIGIKSVRLNTILAILEKHASINLRSADVYVQINGIASNSTDDSIDLAIVMSILSSIQNKTIKQLFKAQKTPVFAGRVTLSGNLRTATNPKERLKASSNLGFEYNPKIENNEEIKKLINNISMRD